jgi:hypothetical protein
MRRLICVQRHILDPVQLIVNPLVTSYHLGKLLSRRHETADVELSLLIETSISMPPSRHHHDAPQSWPRLSNTISPEAAS